jgi:hypothetical protein
MAQKEEPNLMFAEMVEIRKKRVEDFVNAQTELLNKLQETNRQWFDRMQSEASLASDFANKVMAARSIPDAMTACQEWANRRFEMMAEDGKRLLADGQKFIESGTRMLSNGFSGNGRGVSASANQHQG